MVTSLREGQSSHRKSTKKVYKDDTVFKEHPLWGTSSDIKTMVTGGSTSACWPNYEVFTITDGYSSFTLDAFFEIDSASRTRCHPWKLKKKRINTDIRHHLFSDRVINWWNKLDHDVVCATLVNAFKNRLQKWKEMSLSLDYSPINSRGQ